MKSRPASAAVGAGLILVSTQGIGGLSAKSHRLREGFVYNYILLYTLRPPRIPFLTVNDRPDRHALCPLANRLPPHRRGADRALQLALCARPRRQDALADRGHRSRAVDGSGHCRDSGRAEMARARLGWRGYPAI